MSAITVPTVCHGSVRRTQHRLERERAVLVEVFSERLAGRVRHPLDHEIQRPLRGANGSHAVVNTTRATVAH